MKTVLFIALVCQLVNAEDRTLSDGSVSVKVLEKSGKVLISRGSTVEDESDGTVKLTMDGLTEVDVDGNPVGVQDSVKHSIMFVNQTFNISRAEDVMYQNLSARSLNFFAQPDGFDEGKAPTIKVMVYIFKKAGGITNDDGSIEVKVGSIKLDIEISNWQWCNNCSIGNMSETGAALDFMIEIMSNKDGGDEDEVPENVTDKFDIEGLTIISPSQKIQVDGVWMNMTDKYPMWANDTLTLRFPKFNETAMYGLVFELEDNGNGDNDGGGDEVGDGPGDMAPPTTLSCLFIFLMVVIQLI